MLTFSVDNSNTSDFSYSNLIYKYLSIPISDSISSIDNKYFVSDTKSSLCTNNSDNMITIPVAYLRTNLRYLPFITLSSIIRQELSFFEQYFEIYTQYGCKSSCKININYKDLKDIYTIDLSKSNSNLISYPELGLTTSTPFTNYENFSFEYQCDKTLESSVKTKFEVILH